MYFWLQLEAIPHQPNLSRHFPLRQHEVDERERKHRLNADNPRKTLSRSYRSADMQICRYADMQICTNYVSNFPGSKITHEMELSIHKDSIVAQVCASGHRSTIWQSDHFNYESI